MQLSEKLWQERWKMWMNPCEGGKKRLKFP